MKKLVCLGFLVLGLLVAVGCTQSGREDDKGKNRTTVGGRVLKLEELTFAEIDKLDRGKSIFFLTFGNFEAHGPHLPVGCDYFHATGIRDGLIARFRTAHPDYDFVLFPDVPLGEGGIYDLVGQFEHIGTYAVRFETLRNVAIDLGSAIASKGFQNIFLIHGHGSPLHNVAFSEAAGFVSERYKTRMVNITSLMFGQRFASGEGFYSQGALDKYLGAGWEEKNGMDGHGGAAETSVNLFLRGNLVKPEYKQLPLFAVRNWGEAFRLHERTGWQGYWGDPAKASKAMGAEVLNDWVERGYRIAERALAGEDLSELPVYPDIIPPLPEGRIFQERVEENYAKQTTEIEAWLKKRQSANQ